MGFQAVQLGLDGGEDAPLSSEAVRRQWKEEAGRAGLRSAAVAVLAVRRHGMTAEAGSEPRRKAEEAVAVDLAADMGISQTRSTVGASPIRNRDDLRETARCLPWACALAKRRWIRVATENALDGETLKALFRIVGYDNLRFLLDLAGHSRRGGEAVFDALPAFLDVCDGSRVKNGICGQPCLPGRALPASASKSRRSGGTAAVRFFWKTTIRRTRSAPRLGGDPSGRRLHCPYRTVTSFQGGPSLSLVGPRTMLAQALAEGFAVGAFNIGDMEPSKASCTPLRRNGPR